MPATCPGPDDAALGPIQTFAGSFDASLENSFVEIPVEVPAGSTGIRIRYCYEQPDVSLPNGHNNNTLDLGIYERSTPGTGGGNGADRVRCGRGRDRAWIDRGLDDARGCERIRRATLSG